MKICLLGDTHFGVRNDHPTFHKNFARFYNEIFFPYLEKHNILHVVQLGDVFDRRKHINFNTLKQSTEYFFDRLNRDYSTWMLVGNHDTYFKNTNEVNSIDLLLKGYHNITPIQRCTEVDFEGITFLLVPWWCEENDQHIKDSLKQTNATHVIGHFEIDGFEMYKGAVHQGGISRDMFANYEKVFSGHFHHQSKYGNIHYIGTPYEMTWSDFEDPKGFHIFDTETHHVEFVSNPYKIFQKIFYNDDQMTIDTINNMDLSCYADTFVKVVVVKKNNPFIFDLFIDRLEKNSAFNIQIVDDHLNLDQVQDSVIVSDTEDTITTLTRHIRTNECNVDKQKLESLMVNLYNEALSVQ